jgi:hypothetical protein
MRKQLNTYLMVSLVSKALAKSPTSTVRTQSNHVFMSIYAAAKLEILAIKHKVHTFSLRAKLYIPALKNTFLGIQELKSV